MYSMTMKSIPSTESISWIGHDVGMVERGSGPGLLDEAPPTVLVRHALGGQDLDRDLPAQARVARPIDLPHPPRAQQREDFVGPELRSG